MPLVVFAEACDPLATCPGTYKPVCGEDLSDGTFATYANACSLDAASCGQYVIHVCDGTCDECMGSTTGTLWMRSA